MPSPTILITRPWAEAERLAERLRVLGYATCVEPLLTIVPKAEVRRPAGSFSATMLTSPHALEALNNRRGEIRDLLVLPCFCVGDRTAEAARAFGFHRVLSADGDGQALANLVKDDFSGPESLLHIGGEDTASAAPETLGRAGFFLVRWPVYKAVPTKALSAATQEALRENRIQGALFFSPRTAALFAALAAECELQACCQHLSAIGLSQAVCDAWRPLSWQREAAAGTPTESALITRLQSLIPVS